MRTQFVLEGRGRFAKWTPRISIKPGARRDCKDMTWVGRFEAGSAASSMAPLRFGDPASALASRIVRRLALPRISGDEVRIEVSSRLRHSE